MVPDSVSSADLDSPLKTEQSHAFLGISSKFVRAETLSCSPADPFNRADSRLFACQALSGRESGVCF